MSLPNQLTPRPTQDSITVERNAVATVTPVRTDKAYLAPVPGSVVQFDPQGKVVSDCNVPIILRVKDVPVLTAGAPADIATIAVPAGITRFVVYGDAGAQIMQGSAIVSETGGAKDAAAFQLFSAPAGAGTALTAETSGPNSSSFSSSVTLVPDSDIVWVSASSITVRQTVASDNAGTVSFCITIFPLP